MCIDSGIKELNKRELIEQSQACCDEKWETSFHAMTIYGLYSWLDIFEDTWGIKLLKVLLQSFMELNKKRRHTLMCYILVLYCETCNAWNIVINHGYEARQAHHEGKIETSAHVLLGGF